MPIEFLQKLEARYSHLAITGLGFKVAMLKLFSYVCFLAIGPENCLHALNKLGFVGDALGALIIPFTLSSSVISVIFMIFAVLILINIGASIEAAIGKFRLNLYLLSYLVAHFLLMSYGHLSNAAWADWTVQSEDRIYLSVLLAFATLFPHIEFLMFFVIPVKVKWLAILGALGALLMAVIPGGLGLPFALPVLHYLAVMGLPMWIYSHYLKRRRMIYEKALESMAVPTKPRVTASGAPSAAGAAGSFHHCHECGRHELSHPELHFRIGPDGEEYCDEHIQRFLSRG